MGSLDKRITRLEEHFPPAPPEADLTEEERRNLDRLAAAMDAIIATLPAAYRASVYSDLERMGRTPATYPNCEPPENSWYWDGTLSHLSLCVIEMALGHLAGWYSGPLRFPEIVCELMNHRNGDAFEEDNFPHGHVRPPGMRDDDCPACGFEWLNYRLRATLTACPVCETVWTPRVCGHERSVLIGSRQWLHIPPAATEEERRRVGIEALERLGIDEARRWLTDDLELPPAIVDAILRAGQPETLATMAT